MKIVFKLVHQYIMPFRYLTSFSALKLSKTNTVMCIDFFFCSQTDLLQSYNNFSPLFLQKKTAAFLFHVQFQINTSFKGPTQTYRTRSSSLYRNFLVIIQGIMKYNSRSMCNPSPYSLLWSCACYYHILFLSGTSIAISINEVCSCTSYLGLTINNMYPGTISSYWLMKSAWLVGFQGLSGDLAGREWELLHRMKIFSLL